MAREAAAVGPSSLVALTAVAVGFGCALAGCFEPMAPPPPGTAMSLTLLPASWSGHTLPIVIASVHNGGSLAPGDLTFRVLDAREVEYFHGTAGTGSPVNTTTVAVAYGDTTGPGKVTAGDGLVITFNPTAPESFGNGTLEVYANATQIARLRLPAPPPAASQPRITLSAGSWSDGNLTLGVASVANAGNLTPADLLFGVFDSSGTVYYSAGAGHPHTTGSVTVDVFFNDLTDGGHLSAGDSVRLSVSPSTSANLAGGLLSVAIGTQEIGHASLP